MVLKPKATSRSSNWSKGRGCIHACNKQSQDWYISTLKKSQDKGFTVFRKEEFKLRHPKTTTIMYWVPASMNSNNYKVKLKFHLFWFIKNALFKVLIALFQQKLLKFNGSKDSKGRVVCMEPGNLGIINNATLNVFSSIIIDMADTPVLFQAMRATRTEWEHELGRGEAAELYIVVTGSIVDSLDVLGDVDDGGQEG